MELLIRFNAEGFVGAHARDAGGIPTALTEAQLPAAIGSANLAAMARVDVLTQELALLSAELTALKATATQAATAVIAVVDDPSVSDEQTVQAVRQIAVQARMPVRERERAAAMAALAKAQAEAAKFD